MSTVALVLRTGARDLLRSRWIIAYPVGLWLLAEALFFFGGTPDQVVMSLASATLLVVPLVTLVFGTARMHAAREFTTLLLAQPLSRRAVFDGLFLGLSLPLAGAFVVGIVPPVLLHAGRTGMGLPLMLVALCGVLLSFTFTGIAAWIATGDDDRLRAMGRALAAWLLFAFALDFVTLVLLSLSGRWPLERFVLPLLAASPVDLARVLVLSSLDATALLGYTGALFQRLFGTPLGPGLLLTALVAWALVPPLLARRRFLRRDF